MESEPSDGVRCWKESWPNADEINVDEQRIHLIYAESEEHIKKIHELFLEYSASLGFDLCFQDFDHELANLPGEYAPPDGRLLLAVYHSEIAGCVALRKFSEGICEMKRLYVRPAYRGKGIGKILANTIIKEARVIGYQRMCLDTIPAMIEAIALYKSLGFKEIKSYRYNPIPGAVFMELNLQET